MASQSITLEMLERAATRRNAKSIDTTIYSPLFGRDIDVNVFFNDDASTISRHQLRAINQFASLEPELEHIKSELYQHWWNNSDSYEFECINGEHAYANSEFLYLFLNTSACWGNLPCSMLRFRVQWDTEHGAGIFVVDGEWSRFGDSFDWPVVGT